MRRPFRLLVVTLAIVAAGYWVPAAQPSPDDTDPASIARPALRTFTDRDGLPQNGINALAFDSHGYLWAATKDGAASYNGREWRVLGLPPDLGSTWIQSILVASDGATWLGTVGGGVARFDGRSWKVFNRHSGLPGDDVFALLESKSPSGTPVIVVGTNAGVARYEKETWTVLPPIDGRQQSSTVYSLYETTSPEGKRTLWAGTDIAGIGRFEDGAWTRYTSANETLPDDRISCLFETDALDGHRALVAGSQNGLAKFENGRWTAYTGALAPPDGHVRCVRETKRPDGTSVLWVGTPSGLARFDGGRWESLAEHVKLPVSGIWSLLETPSPGGARTLWIGTAGSGLVRWELGRWRTIDDRLGLPNNSVYSLLETENPDGSTAIWVGTITGGLARLERGRWTVYDGSNGFVSDTPLALLETAPRGGARTVWVGTNASGLVLMRGGRVVKSLGTADGLPHMRVACLLEADDGSVLVGTDAGLARVVDDRVAPLDPSIVLPPNTRVRSLLQTAAPDGARTLWIGTEAGLVRAERGATTVYDTKSALGNNVVLSLLAVTSNGQRSLWAGTRGGGITIFDLDRPEPSWRFIRSPLLPNDTVYQLRQDARGRVYAFTNKGVARLVEREPTPDDPAPFAVYVFTSEDGLPSNECNTGASMVDRRGRIWAGTIGGVGVFDPSREIDDTTARPLILERAYLPKYYRSVSPTDELESYENHLVFHFALLSYFKESDVRYRTQLVGFDPEPSDWAPDAKKEYTSLPHGVYAFKVWGRDAAGNVTGPIVMPFTILPATWATWWAYSLYGLIAVGLLYLGVRFRMRALNRRTLQLEAGIEQRTAELANKVDELRASEQRALEARNAAVTSERRARESEQQALEANRAKSTFLANMSHELRTPLNAILGFVQLMERDPQLTAEQQENLGVILRSGEHLLGLINDVLSISKIEAGRATLDVSSFDLIHLLRGLEEMFRLRAESKGLVFMVDLDASVPQFVLGDEAKLRQILINLLGNAVKFTRAGSVTLRGEWREGRALFTVTDTGPGLSSDEMGRLFKAFVQTETGLRSSEGTGLGLAISRDYATLMDGDIAVESELGHGTIFRVEVTLPSTDDVEPPAARARVIGLAPDQPPRSILVVDDLPDNRTLLKKLFAAVGFDVHEASDGREAVDVWNEHRPHIVLMDVRMPVIDGIQATAEIRRREQRAEYRVLSAESPEPSSIQHSALSTQHSALPKHCVIIALTASAFEHDRSAILEAGCNDYVPKPFREAAIFEKLAEHAGVRFRYQETTQERSAPTESTTQALTLERLGALPQGLLDALAEAVTIGDAAAAMATIDNIRQTDPDLADELKGLVRTYQFDALLEWLASHQSRSR